MECLWLGLEGPQEKMRPRLESSMGEDGPRGEQQRPEEIRSKRNGRRSGVEGKIGLWAKGYGKRQALGTWRIW